MSKRQRTAVLLLTIKIGISIYEDNLYMVKERKKEKKSLLLKKFVIFKKYILIFMKHNINLQ